MNSARFEQLLERTMGLTAVSIGTSAVGRAVVLRMSANDLSEEDAYWDLLQRSRAELQELIEAVVVPETWFFRDPQAFMAMARIGKEKASKRATARPLRLLSLPCSTGEEAYTMAMALLDAGLGVDDFRIDGIDISSRSLGLARLGIYGRNSFRSQDLAFRDRYFELCDGGHRIGEAARALVHFSRGNILAPEFLTASEPFDIIFCRNLLIYFDGATQARAIAVLKRLLAPEGVLFAGHSETSLMPANGFVSAKIPMAFAFGVAPEPQGAARLPLPAITSRRPRPVQPAPERRAPPPKREPSRPALQPSIADLRGLADSGRLQEAAEGCERHIRQYGASAQVLLLLALISDASGNSAEAEAHYRRALYLEPDNAEALGHLALLLRRQGDHAGAGLLDDRMRRQAARRAG